MKMDGRRQSSNVVDGRRGGAVKAGGIGLGGILIAVVIYFLTGRAPDPSMFGSFLGEGTTVSENVPQTEEDSLLVVFCSQVLAGTEDCWTEEFKKMGRTYEPAKLYIFSDAVNSGCGNATSASGPFYCSADNTVYLDIEFFKNMKREIGADGDFAYAYVIAHEVGHHVQNQLGILGPVHQKRAQYGKDSPEANQLTVRLELQADFFAGVWASKDNQRFKSLEDGDIDEALDAAAKIGDDYLQKQAYGRTMPETFTHGTSAQRSRWLKKGIHLSRDIQGEQILDVGDTFSPSYSSL